MPEFPRLGPTDQQDPKALPEHLRRLHRRIMRAAREERQERITHDDVDETGRAWRGLVTPPEPTNKEQKLK